MSWWSSRGFDERQLRVRGDIYLHGLVEAAVLMAVLVAVPRGWAPFPYPSVIAVIAVVAAVSAELIWRGAYLAMGPRGDRVRRTWRILGVVYGVLLVLFVVGTATGDNGLWSAGALTSTGASAATYLIFCVIPVTLFLADRRDARLARADELVDEAA